MKMTKILLFTALTLFTVLLIGSESRASLIGPLTVETADQVVNADLGLLPVGDVTASVGRRGTVNQYVLPFALPSLPVGEVVSDATLTFFVELINSFSTSDLPDLNVYGLRSNVSSAVLSTDYDLATRTLLEASVVVGFVDRPDVPKSFSTTDSTGLGSWIKSLYDGGAVAGEFAFLGLSTATPTATNHRYYQITTANGVSNQPTLNLTTTVSAVPEPHSLAFFGLGLIAVRTLRRKSL